MAVCQVSGNDYAKAFDVVFDGETHTFDSFECAIHALAPKCAHCDFHVIGHGVETDDGAIYCCEHCAETGRDAAHYHAWADTPSLSAASEWGSALCAPN